MTYYIKRCIELTPPNIVRRLEGGSSINIAAQADIELRELMHIVRHLLPWATEEIEPCSNPETCPWSEDHDLVKRARELVGRPQTETRKS